LSTDRRAEEFDEALNAFAWELGGDDDIHASARYRRKLVRRIGRQVIEEALACRS
jgi:2-furoyl-CoA dehydrogenase FAD binding subunit